MLIGMPSSDGADIESLVVFEVSVCELFCAVVDSCSRIVTMSPTLCAVAFSKSPES